MSKDDPTLPRYGTDCLRGLPNSTKPLDEVFQPGAWWYFPSHSLELCSEKSA